MLFNHFPLMESSPTTIGFRFQIRIMRFIRGLSESASHLMCMFCFVLFCCTYLVNTFTASFHSDI